MNYYEIPPETIAPTASGIGRRAAELRMRLGLTIQQIVERTGLQPSVVAAFEESGTGTVDTLVTLATHLSTGDELDDLFRTPRFKTAQDVRQFEQRRRAAL